MVYGKIFSDAADGMRGAGDGQGKGRGRGMGRGQQFLMWSDPEMESVAVHFGYKPDDKKARVKLLDYIEKNKILPDDLKKKNMDRASRDKIRMIIDNYEAFTQDTSTL